STYRHWPSANKVSNASEDLPEPDTPVITVTALWGIRSEMFLRLFCRAPSTMRSPDGWISFKGNLVRYGLSQRQFDERDAAQVEHEGAGHGGPEAETVQGQDHEAHVGEPRRDEPEEVFGIAHGRVLPAVQVDQDEGYAGDRRKGASEGCEKSSAL